MPSLVRLRLDEAKYWDAHTELLDPKRWRRYLIGLRDKLIEVDLAEYLNAQESFFSFDLRGCEISDEAIRSLLSSKRYFAILVEGATYNATVAHDLAYTNEKVQLVED